MIDIINHREAQIETTTRHLCTSTRMARMKLRGHCLRTLGDTYLFNKPGSIAGAQTRINGFLYLEGMLETKACSVMIVTLAVIMITTVG